MNRSNQKPHIITIVSGDKKHVKFYVAVQNYLAPVCITIVLSLLNLSYWKIVKITVHYSVFQIPETFGIIGTLDVFYKVHKIFEIGPHTHCKRLMDFLDYFVYRNEDDIDDGFVDNNMRELGEKLLHLSVKWFASIYFVCCFFCFCCNFVKFHASFSFKTL